MYHTIVRRRLRKIYSELNEGKYEMVLDDLAPQFEHVFFGKHALGGTRRKRETYRKWFERLFRLFPDIQFDVKNILVTGWPWDTVAAVEWTDRFTTRDGVANSNAGVNFIRIRWTKVVEARVYHDTEKLSSVCLHQGDLGVQEALSPQILDDVT